jgi:transglutaminase-like putative cysteine protease
MQLTIVHDTVHRYGETAGLILQTLRLWPAAAQGQSVNEWHVDVDGRRTQPTCADGFGNHVATHTIDSKLDSVHIQVRGRVETFDLQGVHRGREFFPPMFFKSCTDRTAPSPQLAEVAREAAGSGTGVEQLHRLVNAIRERMDYLPDHPASEITAAAAFVAGAGGCEDLAHVLIGAVRSLEFPARCVSGYLYSANTGTTALHAWTEVFVDGLGWTGIDAANRRICDERYVRLASGRDHRDAAALRGVIQGGVAEALAIEVSSPRASTQTQPGSVQSQRQSSGK